MKVKSKLEQTIDEIETAHENERRQKIELDKQRRRMEGDLKICQQTLAELERTKKDIENSLTRREREQGTMIQKLEEQQASVREGLNEHSNMKIIWMGFYFKISHKKRDIHSSLHLAVRSRSR